MFSDPRQLRRKRLRRRFLLVLCFFVFWIFAFFESAPPETRAPVLATSLAPVNAATLEFGPELADIHIDDVHDVSGLAGRRRCEPRDRAFAAMARPRALRRVIAHAPVSLEWAHLSLARSCDAIDVLVPDWLTVAEERDGFEVKVVDADTRMAIEAFVADAPVPPAIMPRIQLDTRPLNSAFHDMIGEAGTRGRLLSDLRISLAGVGASGACLDREQFPDGSGPGLRPFLDEFRTMLARAGMQSCLIVSGTDTGWIEQGLSDGFDQVIVKLFDEPWVGSPRAPPARNAWFAATARKALEDVGAERLIVAIGNFGTGWETGKPVPRQMSYGEVMARLADAGAGLTFNAEASASFASYRSGDGRLHKIWLQDAASAFNQISTLAELGIRSIAIWSLGREDPGLWTLLNAPDMSQALDSPGLTSIRLDTYVDYVGAGPAIRVRSPARYGIRTFEPSRTAGRIENQSYRILPRPYVLERYGRPAPNELVLTFDDGPDPEFTPRILQILRETGTPAAFFVVGRKVMDAPGILRQIFEDGHEIGTHSFSHPRMDRISEARRSLEHDLSHRVMASAIGHDTILFREPFLRGGGPISGDRVRSLETAQARGLVIYGMDVVPKDWMGRSGDEIADFVIAQVEQGEGNVILLHDGGGDRTGTLRALPRIISELRAAGYVFKPVSEVLGIERSVLMPPAGGLQPAFDRISFALASGTVNGLVVIFWVVLAIGVARSVVVLGLALLRRRHEALALAGHPRVAVIIPAFNEEKAIGRCIESVLSSDYPHLEIVVVDDGSNDNTLNEVFAFKHEKNLRLISQPNQGKWSALNRALLTLDADVAVCIDADTQIRPDAVSRLARHFFDPRVGAVAGKIVVGNQVNLLTRMQALEYVAAQNFDRRAFDRINGILVVPGAIGAWRVSALRKAGLYRPDTMTEDADLTIAINRAGFRVVYEDRAIAFTEAPRTVRALLRQRLRWSLGMFQSAWRHRRAVRERRSIGLVAIPDMLIFGYLFPLLAPVADAMAVMALIEWLSGGWSGDVGTAAGIIPPDLLWAWLALPALEFAITLVAVLGDRTARAGLLWIWPIQRILYRPLLYLTVYRAILRAMTGTLAVWERPIRQGHDLLARGAAG